MFNEGRRGTVGAPTNPRQRALEKENQGHAFGRAGDSLHHQTVTDGPGQRGHTETPLPLNKLFVTPSKGSVNLIKSNVTSRKFLDASVFQKLKLLILERTFMTQPGQPSSITSCVTRSTQVT